MVEIKQTATRLKINSEKKYLNLEKRNRRWDAIISEQIVLFKFFSLKQIMVDLRTAIPFSSAMRVQGVTLPSWSRLVTTMLRVGWVFDSTYLSSGFKVRPKALMWRKF